ncbi:hypothetical protein CV102_25460 [Natronococcus pandeyae]|uniref:Uncharacterized protein n=1 Tax=Natronococcus pandeyae TaxID=2055836 RepID=A0A8J8TMS4_9EURY|nr:hypothetical protein [Natronococcus pandeyae]TYL35901.1 hypothetical protein CV102_25460 [Natronococcus pandeyae]
MTLTTPSTDSTAAERLEVAAVPVVRLTDGWSPIGERDCGPLETLRSDSRVAFHPGSVTPN